MRRVVKKNRCLTTIQFTVVDTKDPMMATLAFLDFTTLLLFDCMIRQYCVPDRVRPIGPHMYLETFTASIVLLHQF